MDFSKKAQFNNVMFNGEADFSGSSFNDYADFYNVTFNSNVKMNVCKFGDVANFMDVTFGNDADFNNVNFNGIAYFNDASFNGDANFRYVKFNHVDFSWADFNKNVDFRNIDFQKMVIAWNSLEDRLTCDGLVYIKLIKNFRDRESYDDADKAYYQYRKQNRKDENGFSWLLNIIMELSCGYGVRPLYAVGFGLFFVFGLFPLIYVLLGMSVFSAIECSCITFITGYNHEIAKSTHFTNNYGCHRKIILSYGFRNKNLSWGTHARLVKLALISKRLFGWLILPLLNLYDFLNKKLSWRTHASVKSTI
ncbi:MAG: hypothetical protein E4G94_03815 [ANME-2 cluster archaeon]|nr:MAG: hypothetical protein E4G94_03815 [ANME-2 cluster archaeon]